MSYFDRPEHASHLALCRELRLEREFELGDWRIWEGNPTRSDGGPNIHLVDTRGTLFVAEMGRPRHWTHAQVADRDGYVYIWLPLVHDWLDLLEEVGVRELAIGPDFAQVEIGPHAGEDGCGSTREEALARLFMAVTGRAERG